ncbi:MAG: S41 family peptidase [Micromonosporaceae bacterium]
MTPALFKAAIPAVSSKLPRGHIAYVKLPEFSPRAAAQVLQAISGLASKATLRGVILDLRGNGGGSPGAAARLLGAFIYSKAWGYDCTTAGHCAANYPDPKTRFCTCR